MVHGMHLCRSALHVLSPLLCPVVRNALMRLPTPDHRDHGAKHAPLPHAAFGML